jgi:hypothetical protein
LTVWVKFGIDTTVNQAQVAIVICKSDLKVQMKTPQEYAANGTEFAHQAALFQWARVAARFGLTAASQPQSYKIPAWAQDCLRDYADAMPKLQWLHAIKNAGHGDAIRGARSAAEGVKAGVPDIFLPVPRGDYSAGLRIGTYHGLYIELKRPVSIGKRKGVASTPQDEWQSYLAGAGYGVAVCFGWEAARDILLKYLGR